MAAYVGKYDRTSAENYDEFLSELGVNFLLRKAATASSPVFEVCKLLLHMLHTSIKLQCTFKCNVD